MIGVLDHEMDVEREFRVLSNGRDDSRPERNVIDEMAVHDVEMQPIGAGLLGAVDLVLETGEVRGEDGRSDQCFHADETLLRKVPAGKLSKVFLFRYRFLFISGRRGRGRGSGRTAAEAGRQLSLDAERVHF
jgi:hypothetical protein